MAKNNQNFRNKQFANQQSNKKQKGAKTSSPAKNTYNSDVKASKSAFNGFKMSEKTEKWLPAIYFLLFGIAAYIYLAVLNKDYLYTCQEFSIWQNTGEYFDDKMRFVGGFSQWLGCYLTQYLYYPSVGALLMISVWALMYFLTIKVFRISNRWSFMALIPAVLLLCSNISLGYWLYYIKLPGYWFTYSIAFTLMLLGMYICNLYRGYVRAILIVLYVIGFYPIIGFWSLLGAAYMAIQSLTGFPGSKPLFLKDINLYVTFVASAAAIVIVPRLYYSHYTTIRPEDVYTALFPIFQHDKFSETNKHILFTILACSPLLYSFPIIMRQKVSNSSNIDSKSGKLWLICSIIMLATSAIAINSQNVSDPKFKAELKMYNLLNEYDWDGVLEASREVSGPHTRQMIMTQNVALFHRGNIGDLMFKYDNRTVKPEVTIYSKSKDAIEATKEKYKNADQNDILGDLEKDSLHVNLSNTTGSLFYFLYGKCNFATRWCIENGVEYGFRVNELKILARCAMMTGEDNLASKYVDILRTTTFHKEWAEKRLEWLHDRKKYESSTEYRCVRPMYDAYKNALDGDQGLIEVYLVNYFSHMNNDHKKFQEACIAFSLIQKDIELFWQKFFKYAELHEKDPMPIHFQEAAYLFGDLEHKVDTSHMPFDKTLIVNRYASFKNVTGQLMQQYAPKYKNDETGLTRKVGEECFAQFGDTYWWFYYFSRGVQTY